MPRVGLTQRSITDAAMRLIEEQGNHAFTLGALARCLGIKPASLYNHFRDMEELTGEVGYRIGHAIGQALTEAVAGKTRDGALIALCHAYRAFAKEHMDLYKVIMGMQKDKNAHTERACREFIRPIKETLGTYRLGEADITHAQRLLRATLHGFITHEYAGGFSHTSETSDASFAFAVEGVLTVIHKKETEALYL